MSAIATPFTPLAALLGGALIGFAAALLMLANGRVAGISGILGAALSLRPEGARAERLAFLAGLVSGPLLVAAVAGLPEQRFVGGVWAMGLAGLLVGFGTMLGGGCTSGHGVCGLARLSKRSAAATAIFMAVAVATVFLMRHAL